MPTQTTNIYWTLTIWTFLKNIVDNNLIWSIIIIRFLRFIQFVNNVMSIAFFRLIQFMNIFRFLHFANVSRFINIVRNINMFNSKIIFIIRSELTLSKLRMTPQNLRWPPEINLRGQADPPQIFRYFVPCYG